MILGIFVISEYQNSLLQLLEKGWVGFYGLLSFGGYLMPNPLNTYILDIYDLVGLGFIAYKPL